MKLNGYGLPMAKLSERKHKSNKAMGDMAYFACFCFQRNIHPSDLAELMMLLKKCVKAAVKYSNSGLIADKRREFRLSKEWEVMAKELGFTNITWPGYFPTASKNDEEHGTINEWPTDGK